VDSIKIEKRVTFAQGLEEELDAIRRDPRKQAQFAATGRLMGQMMNAYLLGYRGDAMYRWAHVKLSDEDRALLAKDAEAPERPLLPGGDRA
jgi:hypothetical protein